MYEVWASGDAWELRYRHSKFLAEDVKLTFHAFYIFLTSSKFIGEGHHEKSNISVPCGELSRKVASGPALG